MDMILRILHHTDRSISIVDIFLCILHYTNGWNSIVGIVTWIELYSGYSLGILHYIDV